MKKYIIFFGGVFLNILAFIDHYREYDDLSIAISHTLPILLVTALIVIIVVLLDLNKIQNENTMLKEELINCKRNYSKMQDKNMLYEFCWDSMNKELITVINRTQQKRIETAYDLFLKYTEMLKRSNLK